MKSLNVVCLGALALLLLAGCPDTGIVCQTGTERCGQGCIDPKSDAKNCGACGNACRSGQICNDTVCTCSAGTSLCSGECTVIDTDVKNCGTCGHACVADEVCEQKICRLVCPITQTICGGDGGVLACSNLQTDPANCGTCEHACGATEVCDLGTCKANCTGTSTQCGNACVNVMNDPAHCGNCATACLSIEACDAGNCQTNCPAATPTRCANACVNTDTSATHCGGCGVTCENSQSCRSGHCAYDLVAACFSSGQLVGMQQSSEFRGPAESLGTGPAALAAYGQTVLVADGIDQKLYQADMRSVGGHAFAKLPQVAATGSVPNQVVVDAPYVYVINSGSGTLQVLRKFDGVYPDGGAVADGGVGLLTVAELPLGANSYPEAVVKVGTSLWIPLYGGFGAAGAAAGQKVLKVDVSTPSTPTLVAADTVDLSGVNLKPFDGGAPVARPYAILSHQGFVYVALNNLNPDTYLPEGPGLLAKINPTTKAVSIIDLGADKCLNPLWLASDGTHLLVSCGGAAVYNGPPNYELLSTDKAAVVLLDSSDVRQSTWTPGCPLATDGGAGCAPILLSRFALSQGRAYVGDQNGGRVFVLDINGNSLGERRGYYGDAGAAINACALDPVTHIANVSDVLAVP